MSESEDRVSESDAAAPDMSGNLLSVDEEGNPLLLCLGGGGLLIESPTETSLQRGLGDVNDGPV